jgi:SagB-type dehydrogenase family enzyme
MKVRKIGISVWLFLIVFVVTSFAAEQAKVIKLPAPRTDGGKPLMQALKERNSNRNLSSKEISLQVLADLLWAAFGVNRPETGGRTAPSAQNMREIDIYVAKKDGLYLYNASENSLEVILSEDIRSATGNQVFVKDAPLNLVYVADYSKMSRVGNDKDFYAAADCGFIAQNVYLFCASFGLATVVRGWFEPEKLKNAMKLRPDQKIILTQTVGYPQ